MTVLLAKHLAVRIGLAITAASLPTGLEAWAQTAPAQSVAPTTRNIIIVPGPIGSGTSTVVGGDPASSTPTAPAAAPLRAVASGRAAATASTNACGSSQPPEIVDLARALKGDPDLVHQHVYSTIDTIPRAGSLKGPLGTLIDRAGTAVDQAELMVALLQQGGNCSASLQLGYATLSPAMLKNWLGSDTSNFANQAGIGTILASGGYRSPGGTAGLLINYQNSNQLGAAIDWAWVRASVGGVSYAFDPAAPAKYATRKPGLVASFAGFMGFDPASFVSGAMSSATVTANSVSGIDRNFVRGIVGAYANNLLGRLRDQPQAQSGITDVLGTRSIVPLSPSVRPRDTALPNSAGSVADAATLPPAMRTTVTFSLCSGASCSAAVSYATSDLYGRRLSIVFDGSASPVPTLRLDGAVQATGASTAPGAAVVVKTSIVHPYLTPNFNRTDDISIRVTATANGVFVVSNGWGPVSRGMIEKHRQRLAEAQAQNPGATNSEAVIGESLAVLGYTWLAEHSQAQLLIDSIGGTFTHYHNALGISGLSYDPNQPGFVGPYVDLPINTLAIAEVNNRANSAGFTVSERATFLALGSFASILESGSIEQVQRLPAASTSKLLDIWGQRGPIFDVKTCADYQAVRGQLVDYRPGDLTQIDGLMGLNGVNCTTSTNNRVVLPKSGSITDASIGRYNGSGYVLFASNGGVGQIISGGLSGGFAGQTVSTALLPNAPGQTGLIPTLDPATFANSVTIPPPSGATSPTVGDPINAVSGAYLYSHDDLTLGSNAFPAGLGFQRSYDSTRSTAGSLGIGWTHNFDVSQRRDSDGFAGMAASSPQQGSIAIAGFQVLKAILTAPQSNADLGIERVVIAAMISRYVMDSLTDNVVQVTQPGQVENFVRNADGSFSSPLGSSTTLAAGPGGSYLYRTKDLTTLTLGASGPGGSGPVTQLTNRAGVTVNFGYDGSGKLTLVSNTFQRGLVLAYNGSKLASVSDGTRSVSYGYDGLGRLTSFTNPLGHATYYAYDAGSRMTQFSNPSFPNNPYLTNVYDNLGRVQQQTDADGNLTDVYVAGNRTEIHLRGNRPNYPISRVSTVTYLDALGRVAFEQDGMGGITTINRTSAGWVDSRALPEGNKASYEYDQAGNVTAETQVPKPGSPLPPRTRRFTFEQQFNPLLSTASSVTQIVPTDRPLSSTDFTGNVTNYSYDPQGNVASVTLPLVAGGLGTDQKRPVTTYTYDLGRLTSTTDPEGMATTYYYEPNRAEVGAVTMDAGAGRLNLITRYGYDAFGNRTAVLDPKLNQTSYAYDAARQLVQVTPPAPFSTNRTIYTWTKDGLPETTTVVSSNPSVPNAVTRLQYLPSGKTSASTDPLGNITRYYYDQQDNVQAVVDAEDRLTYIRSDANDRIISVDTTGKAIDVRLYSPNGALIQRGTGSGGSRIDYNRDGFDRLAARVYPDGATEQFTYTPDDDLASYRTRAGQTTSYTHDALHRVTNKAGNPSISYRYDYVGRLRAATTPPVAGDPSTGQWVTYYDTAGRPVVTGSPDGRATGHGWDAAGNQINLCALNVGSPGWTACFLTTHDTQNRVQQLLGNFLTQNAGLLSTEFYDGLGRFGTRVNYNEAYSGMSYNGASANLSRALHVFADGGITSYEYGFNRVNQVTSHTSSLSVARPPAAGTVNLGAANALDQVAGGAPSLTYDARGNMVSDGTRTYGYNNDGDGRLTSVTAPGLTASYRYDPFGRRYSKTVNGVTTVYLHDLAGNAFAEFDGASNGVLRYRRYSPTSAAPVVTLAPDGVTAQAYSNVDRLGSVVSLSDAGGNHQSPVAYLPYGQSSTGAPPPGAGFGYGGYRHDPETGLYYLRNRYYDPRLGRFTQPDPIRHDGGVNIYAYVSNDPLNATDPEGLVARDLASGAYDLFLRPGVDGVSDLLNRLNSNPLGTVESLANSFPQTKGLSQGALSLGALGTIAQNAARGGAFERAGIQALNATKNNQTLNVVPYTRGTIPDVLGSGITEFKDVLNVSYTAQLQLQVAYARFIGQPMNLVVSSTTKTVSTPLQQAISNTGGTIQRFNPQTGVFGPFP